MKVMYRKDAEPYVPAGHYDVKCIRLHDQNTSGSEHLIVGVSYFLPNGGGAEYKKVPEDTNLIYYIVSGEMTVTTDEGEFIPSVFSLAMDVPAGTLVWKQPPCW